MKYKIFIKCSFILIWTFTTLLFTFCSKDSSSEVKDTFNPEHDRYIVFFLTNVAIEEAANSNSGRDANINYNFFSELPFLFGKINKESKNKYAIGLIGPMPLTWSVDEMRNQINIAFDAAEKYDVPIYFQLDDCNNYTTAFGDGANPKYYENPDWVEWASFPKEGELWGGQSNGRPPYFWLNWGAWMHAEAFPCFQSQGFRDYMVSRLKEGVLDPLNKRYEKLKAEGREYLFAGIAVGWETHIPDYEFMNIDLKNLPVDFRNGDKMEAWEVAKLGYNSLNILGYKEYNLEALYKVIHDYSELLSKTTFDSGIPRHKIFTHIIGLKSSNPSLKTTFAPPIWTAVNQYSIPGFTLSPYSCPYNLNVLKSEISKADNSQKYFALAEGYSKGVDGSLTQAENYFASMFDNGSLIVSAFGWGREAPSSVLAISHSQNNPFVIAAKNWIKK